MSSYNHFGCSWCRGPFNGGNCSGCSSVGFENEFVYDPNPYSYNETANFFNQPPQHQYETYSCELCRDSPHYGFDCQTRTPLVYEQDPCPHYSSDCQAGNTPIYDQGPCYNQNFNDDQPSFILQISNNSLTVVRSVEVPIIALIVKPGTSLSMRLILELLRTLKPNSPTGEPEGSDDYTEVTYDKEQCLSDHYTAPVTPPAYTPSIPFLATMEPFDTLLMGDEVISIILARKTDEFIKSSVDDLVPISRESEDHHETMTLYEELIAEIGLTIQSHGINDRDTTSDVFRIIVYPTESASSLNLPLPDPKKIYLRDVEIFDPFFSLTQSEIPSGESKQDDLEGMMEIEHKRENQDRRNAWILGKKNKGKGGHCKRESEKITLPNESVPANEPSQYQKITRRNVKELDEKMTVLVCLESKEQKLALDKYLQVLTMRINSCTIV
ncbi:hypothetical protein Tco_0365984 [Tanacetum coccineum]